MEINSMQALVDGMSTQWQRERSATQMTLGDLITRLEKMDPILTFKGLGDLDSYRGYYCDLAFEPVDTYKSVLHLTAQCNDAMGKVFTGYKGGNYQMGETTPLWVAHYGGCGVKLTDINDDGTIETAKDDD